jgi:hypothetical protein
MPLQETGLLRGALLTLTRPGYSMKTILAYIVLALLSASLALGKEPGYFPVDEKGVKGISEFENQWYSKALKRMEEASFMATMTNRAKLFRFILLPTWGNPISVRLSITGEVGKIEGKRLDGQGGYDPGKLANKTSVTLTKEEVDEFTTLYSKMEFFSLNTADKKRGLDGSQWIFEAVDGGTYHVVVRWSPTEYDPAKRQTVSFVNVCKWLYEKSRIKGNATNKEYTEID